MKSNLFISQLSSVLVAGAQPNVSSKEIDSFGFYFPKTLKEQTKLGIFFKQLDETIALHQRQLENYKELKKLMLQKIFNRELCFKDENGNDYPEWEEIALKELGETFTFLETNWTEKELRKLSNALDKTLNLISQNPYIFQSSDFKKNIRRAVILSLNSLYLYIS